LGFTFSDLAPCQVKMRSTQKYWAPTLELRFSHFGFSDRRGLDGVRADVAEPARHADPVRPDELFPEVVALVGVVLRRVPRLGRRLVEVGIREEPQAHDAGRPSVGGADRQLVLASGADGDAQVLLVVLERVRRTVGAPLVEPEAVAVGIGPFRLLEARLVDETEEVSSGCPGSPPASRATK